MDRFALKRGQKKRIDHGYDFSKSGFQKYFVWHEQKAVKNSFFT